MTKKIFIKNILFGFISWLIPFVASFLFYKPDGELVVPYAVFKTVIMLIGIISGCYLLFKYFKSVESDFKKQGAIVGLTWFAINIFLDVAILIPMMKTNFSDYFTSIGLSYIAIPIISITVGYSLERKLKQI